jgi:hypothetical protein
MNTWTRLWTRSVTGTLLGAGFLAACASSTPNYYRRSLSGQEKCCGRLGDPGARDACLAEIPRVDSTAAETSPTNQETFHCVEEHFVCDKGTGRATRESAQAQLDCLNQLESTAQIQ